MYRLIALLLAQPAFAQEPIPLDDAIAAIEETEVSFYGKIAFSERILNQFYVIPEGHDKTIIATLSVDRDTFKEVENCPARSEPRVTCRANMLAELRIKDGLLTLLIYSIIDLERSD